MKNKQNSLKKDNARQSAGLAVLLFAVTLFAASGSYSVEKVLGILGAAGVAAMLAFADRERFARLLTPLSFAVLAYVGLGGLSTLYARSGKFAISEFARMLISFALFIGITLYISGSRRSFRMAAGAIAAAGVPVGLLSIDAASANVLMPALRVLMSPFSTGYAEDGALWYSRLHTIFGNPNTYAGLMSVTTLFALWLVLTAENRKQRARSGVLLMIDAVSYVLAFSMGSLGVFVLACLLLLALCVKKERAACLLLLLQTAVVALAASGAATAGFSNDGVSGSFLPLIMVAVGCVVFVLLELFVRPKLAALLCGKGKVLVGTAAALIVLAAVYVAAGLNIAGPYTFGGVTSFARTASLAPGEYSLTVEADQPVKVRVAYKNEANLIRNTDTQLAVGDSVQTLDFTVPEDSKLAFVSFACDTPGVTISSAVYSGAETGALKLRYKLLPAFVADRVQDLAANGNVMQRGVYRQDALRLFATAPVFGRGLGGFQNGVASVQDYYYETKYAHNHYAELLCDLGAAGLLAFLAMLGCAVWSLLKSRREKPMIVAVLAACVLQMFGQAISDVTWSVGACVPMFFTVLALITVFCGDALRFKLPQKSAGVTTVRAAVIVYCAAFAVMIGLNFAAQCIFRSTDLTLDKLKACVAMDVFEKNDYKLSFLMSNGGGEDPDTAAKYAEDLSREQSNTITIPLAQYYAGTGQFDLALDTLEQGEEYMRADAETWQKAFTIYEDMLDPGKGGFNAVQLLEQKSRFAGRMHASYDKLREVNAQQLDDVLLTVQNNSFVNRLLKVASFEEGDLKSALRVFDTLAIDTAYLPDVNSDGTPDNAHVPQGEVEWGKNGAFTAKTDCTVEFAVTIAKEGDYFVTVQADSLSGVQAQADSTELPLDPATGKSTQSRGLLGGDMEHSVLLRVKAGTTVQNMVFAID